MEDHQIDPRLIRILDENKRTLYTAAPAGYITPSYRYVFIGVVRTTRPRAKQVTKKNKNGCLFSGSPTGINQMVLAHICFMCVTCSTAAAHA